MYSYTIRCRWRAESFLYTTFESDICQNTCIDISKTEERTILYYYIWQYTTYDKVNKNKPTNYQKHMKLYFAMVKGYSENYIPIEDCRIVIIPEDPGA